MAGIMKLLEKLGIHDRESFEKVAMQFIKFALVGLMNTGIMLGIYYVFVWINPEWYQLGNAVGYFVSIASAAYFGRRFVFKGTTESRGRTLLKSYITYGSTALLASVLLRVQVEWLGISQYIAPVLNLFVTIPLNYLINRFWTFKQTSKKS